MANLQQLTISVLLILAVTFFYLAEATEAPKGPKITSKVGALSRRAVDRFFDMHIVPRYSSTSLMMTKILVGLCLDYMVKRYLRRQKISVF